MLIADTGHREVDLDEAARQLEQAAHDAQVAYDSISLGNLDRAHTSAIIARAEADAAENALRAALQMPADRHLPEELDVVAQVASSASRACRFARVMSVQPSARFSSASDAMTMSACGCRHSARPTS